MISKEGFYYKITVEVSLELIQDLKAIMGLDPEEELIKLLTEEFQEEIKKVWKDARKPINTP